MSMGFWGKYNHKFWTEQASDRLHIPPFLDNFDLRLCVGRCAAAVRARVAAR